MQTSPDPTREMHLLDQIERDPDVTQASLATQLGVAVGTVNWHLKRLIAKGYVKIKRAERRKLRYIITPEGIALRARLTVDYVEQSMLLYRRVRSRVRELLAEAKQAGYSQLWLDTGEEVNGADINGAPGNGAVGNGAAGNGAPGNGAASNGADIIDICRLTCLEQGVKLVDEDRAGQPGHYPRLEIRGLKVFLHLDDDSPDEKNDGTR